MKKTIKFFGKEYEPAQHQVKYFWMLFVAALVPAFLIMYLTLLGIKNTIAFNSWILSIIMFLILFLEVTTSNEKKHTLLPQPIKTLVFIGFCIAGLFA